ncbi:hypothetical protein E4T42_08938 [Aureobasidium subglaciale]|nr:hypothetical protein E4T42_08938 [Aureobasidium subglaciale]
MDSQTIEELITLQEQIGSTIVRKRRKESEDLRDQVEHLEYRLAPSIYRCQKVNTTKAELSRKYEQLGNEKEILERKLEQQDQSHLDLTETLRQEKKIADSFREEVGTLKVKHFKSGIKIERFEERGIAIKKVISELKAKFGGTLRSFSGIDDTSNSYHIRELSLNNKYLAKKNENLRVENHNLKTTNDMLKNKAARDQAIKNATATIKDLEKYNQTLEDENIHLREQLELFTEKKKIDDQLAVLRTEVVEIDSELVKRMVEMDIIEKLEAKIKALKKIDSQESDESNTEEDEGEDGEDLKDSESSI